MSWPEALVRSVGYLCITFLCWRVAAFLKEFWS
jgi:hypothetical protein